MADVFISYSRTDRDVVKPLHDALVSRHKNVWVDWEDIPPTAKWMEDIYAAIEAADAIVFIISPDSVKSDICTQELEYAASRNKRLIPLVCREIVAASAPEALRPLNWLFFTEGNIESAADVLIEVLETDLDWVKSHTRILTRAVEWEKKQQDSSLLLRGNDLQVAEDWLGRGDNKAPQPTPLHGAYIAASRRLSNSRLRRLLVAVSMALLITIGLGLYAYRLFLLADHRANLAESRQFSAQSKDLPIQDHDLSLLLAAKAYQTYPTQEATDAVLNALARYPQLVCYFHGSGEAVRTVRFSPDGRMLASGCADSIIRLWDVQTCGPGSTKLEGHNDAVRALAFSSDGKILASGSDDNTICLWDMLSPVYPKQPLIGHEASVTAVAFNPNGALLASGDYVGDIRFWDMHSGRTIGPPDTSHGDFVASLAFSPDGRIMASASEDGTIRLWDANRFSVIGDPLTGHEIYVSSVAFSLDGRLMASGSYDKTVRLWSVADRRTIGTPFVGHQNEVQSVSFSPDGRLLASSGYDHQIILWDLETRSMRGTPMANHTDVVESVAFSPDGRFLASGGWDGKTILWKTDSALCLESVLTGSAKPLDKSDDKQMDALQESIIGTKIISLWNVTQRTVETTLTFGPSQGISGLVFAPDGQTLFASSYDGNLKKWNLKQSPPEPRFISKDPFPVDPREYARRVGGNLPLDRIALFAAKLNSPHNRIHSLALSSDGRWLAAGRSDHRVHLWDLTHDDTALPPLTGHTEVVTDIAFHPKRSILVSSAGTTRWIWDFQDSRPMGKPLTTIDKSIRSMAFSADGSLLAFSDYDNMIYLWDLAKDHLSGPVLTAPVEIDGIALSPDNRSLASIGTGEDNQTRLQLWDLNLRLPMGPALLCQEKGDKLTFSPDGKLLAIAGNPLSFSPDGNILAVAGPGKFALWDMDPNSWIRKSRKMANREFTPEERQRYLGE